MLESLIKILPLKTWVELYNNRDYPANEVVSTTTSKISEKIIPVGSSEFYDNVPVSIKINNILLKITFPSDLMKNPNSRFVSRDGKFTIIIAISEYGVDVFPNRILIKEYLNALEKYSDFTILDFFA